jgi:hypothetical protein
MSILPTLFAQKTWANNELFNQLATVTAPEHASQLHAAIRTLNHIYVVDRIFRAHLLGQPHGYTATNTDATPTLGELHFAAAEQGASEWDIGMEQAWIRDGMLGEKRSFSGAKARLFNDADRPKACLIRPISRSDAPYTLGTSNTAPPSHLASSKKASASNSPTATQAA